MGYFSLSRFKLDHYVFPAAPALSLLCALAWAEIRERAETGDFLAKPDPFYCVMLGPAYDEFHAKGLPIEVAYERNGMWATSGGPNRLGL